MVLVSVMIWGVVLGIGLFVRNDSSNVKDWTLEELGNLGDFVGLAGGLLSAFALVLTIVSLRYQREEIDRNQWSQKEANADFQAQLLALNRSVRATTLSTQIAVWKSRLAEIGLHPSDASERKELNASIKSAMADLASISLQSLSDSNAKQNIPSANAHQDC